MPKSVLQAVLGRVQSTLHATRRTPRGASRLVQAMSAWLVKTRRAPSRHSRDAKVYGHATTAIHKPSTPPHLLRGKLLQTKHNGRRYNSFAPEPAKSHGRGKESLPNRTRYTKANAPVVSLYSPRNVAGGKRRKKCSKLDTLTKTKQTLVSPSRKKPSQEGIKTGIFQSLDPSTTFTHVVQDKPLGTSVRPFFPAAKG